MGVEAGWALDEQSPPLGELACCEVLLLGVAARAIVGSVLS